MTPRSRCHTLHGKAYDHVGREQWLIILLEPGFICEQESVEPGQKLLCTAILLACYAQMSRERLCDTSYGCQDYGGLSLPCSLEASYYYRARCDIDSWQRISHRFAVVHQGQYVIADDDASLSAEDALCHDVG